MQFWPNLTTRVANLSLPTTPLLWIRGSRRSKSPNVKNHLRSKIFLPRISKVSQRAELLLSKCLFQYPKIQWWLMSNLEQPLNAEVLRTSPDLTGIMRWWFQGMRLLTPTLLFPTTCCTALLPIRWGWRWRGGLKIFKLWGICWKRFFLLLRFPFWRGTDVVWLRLSPIQSGSRSCFFKIFWTVCWWIRAFAVRL